MKRVENMEMDLKESKKIVTRIEEKLSKFAALDNNYVEEEITVNIRYVSKTEGLKIIVDSGAPLLIVSNGWLENM